MPTSTPAELAKRHLEKQAAKKGKTIVEVELPNTKKDEDKHGRPKRGAKKEQVQPVNSKRRKAVELIKETQDEDNGGLRDNQDMGGENEAGTATNIEENADVNKKDDAPNTLHKDSEDEQERSENLVDDNGEEKGSIYEKEEDDEEESSDADDDAPPQKKTMKSSSVRSPTTTASTQSTTESNESMAFQSSQDEDTPQ
jgi:hypothetical protein